MGKSGLYILMLLCYGITFSTSYAQEGFGTQHPSKAAVVELESTQRGVLMPRVALVKTTQFSPPIIGEPPTNTSKVNALLVYNTATQNDVTPGFYYWSVGKEQWQRLLTNTDGELLKIEPWYRQQTNLQATLNTHNIYVMGAVAVKKDSTLPGASLDVKGAMVGGETADSIVIGNNSLAYGYAVEASGVNATALGFRSLAQGDGAFAGGGYRDSNDNNHPYPGGKALGVSTFSFGYETIANANYAVALGYKNEVTANYGFSVGRDNHVDGTAAVALGRQNQANGSYAVALGRQTQAEGFYAFTMGNFLKAKTQLETVFGSYNELFTGNTINAWHPEDPLFVIGNGQYDETNGPQRHNALTILKKGWVGIGIDGNTTPNSAKPTQMLDVGSGKIRFRALPQQVGNHADSLVVVNDDGILKSIPQSSLKSRSPWFTQADSLSAQANNADVFLLGTVAIGKEEVVHNTTTFAQLDVEGAIRGGIQHQSGASTQIGENSIGVGQYVEASGYFSTAFGYKSKASGEGSFAGGGALSAVGGEASGTSAFAFGHHAKASGNYALALGDEVEATQHSAVALGYENEVSGMAAAVLGRNNVVKGNYSFAMGRNLIAKAGYQAVFGRYNALILGAETQWNSGDPLFQIGNGTSATQRSNALTILKNGWVGIGASSPSGTEKLYVDGTIATISATYPDYVFQNYYGQAKSKYKFWSLKRLEDYLKQHQHLPGILSASQLQRTSEGAYVFDMTQLSIASLEKIEELFLYVIEARHQRQALSERVNQLAQENQDLKQRLLRLEERIDKLTAP